ncbi:MAG: hypothetical protein Q8877_02860 [Sweet potato little leaf phytoplasma]|nr:hypothetical protein [Sweet potato little leaf phytoplasma]
MTFSLAAVGEMVSQKEQVRVILDGLPSEYEAFVTSLLIRDDPVTVGALEAMLVAHLQDAVKPLF